MNDEHPRRDGDHEMMHDDLSSSSSIQ